VRVVSPEINDFERRTSQPGTAHAYFEADLGARVSGYVEALNVDIGDRVVANQVLARIAVPELVEARNVVLARVEALRSELERSRALVERGSVTQRSLDEALARYDSATAEQREIEAQIEFATIQAPFAGLITHRAMDPGDMVFEAGSPKGTDQPLLRVARVDLVRVTSFLPELDAVWANVGDPVAVRFDALPGREFVGTVARVSGVLDPGTRSMQVEVDLPNADGTILPGMYGRMSVLLETRRGVLTLPASALRFSETGAAWVYRLNADGTVARSTVSIGIDDGIRLEILDGIAAGDRVVDGMVDSLRDGERV
jgi:RND family efflux transporter MFP subunit